MENVLTLEQLNKLDKTALVELALSQASQLQALNQKMDKLLEQIAASNNARFGRSTEAGLVDENQLCLFNEAEAVADGDADTDVGDTADDIR